MIFCNLCYYFWGQHWRSTETNIFGNDFFFNKFPLPSTVLLLPLPYRCSGVPEYACFVNKLRQIVGLQTWIWRHMWRSTETNIFGNDSFFNKFPLPSTVLLLPLPYRCSGVPEYACFVDKLRQIVGLQTWIWRHMLRSWRRSHVHEKRSSGAETASFLRRLRNPGYNDIVTVQQWYCDGNLLEKRKILRISLLRFQSSLNPDHKTHNHLFSIFTAKRHFAAQKIRMRQSRAWRTSQVFFCFCSLITRATESQSSQKIFCLFQSLWNDHKPNFTLIPWGNLKLLGQKKSKFIVRSKSIVESNFCCNGFFFSLSIFNWNYNNRYWYSFASLVAILYY